MKEKKWHPNGWYYDDKKDKWVAPDYQYVQDEEFKPVYEAEHGAKSPTGWTYDRDKLKWDPPKELSEESARKWRWDPEKRIWIDQDKEARMQRYREYWKDKRTEPTYEEWRAAKLAEEQKKAEEQAQLAPAPGPEGAGEP